MNNNHPFQVYNASAGSGKTFTLVKEYLKILLTKESDFVFQSILAVTFTNKAAAEMKERILENLRAFSQGEKNDMFLMLVESEKLDAKKTQKKATRVLQNILQNYSAFSITTIDSFTHKLIRTFAYDLGLPINFDVEMDSSKLISEAVDVLISKIGTQKELTKILVDFSLQKVEDDKAWDISRELNTVAKILMNEDDVSYLKNIQVDSVQEFLEIEKKLQKKKKEIEDLFYESGNKGLKIIKNAGIDHKSFTYSGELPKHFVKLTELSKLKYDVLKFDGRLQKNIEKNSFYAKAASPDVKEAIDAISNELIAVYEEGKNLYAEYHDHYILIQMVLKGLIPLAVLNYIQKELDEIKTQNNICLSAEFNSIISDKIKDEPAPFIYERIGEKFSHYFIDEMQDTSTLQWQNLIPLIGNALSQQGGSLLLVGDAKQAIYRWRGGKAEQFVDLSMENKTVDEVFYVEKKLENLGVNYRSFSEIINFNNAFFSHISGNLTNPVYRNLYEVGNQQEINKNIGGYVQLDFVDKKALEKEDQALAYPKKVLEVLQNLDAGFKRKDVCVIVRTKKDGVAVANYLVENQVSIISSETLLVQNSLKVKFVVDLLRYIQNPLDLDAKFSALVFLKNQLDGKVEEHDFYAKLLHEEMDSFFEILQEYQLFFERKTFMELPFYESLEYLIRSFGILETTDAYVQFFLDFILEFQRKNYVDLSSFLTLWEDKKETLSISAVESDDSVRIMTIHKSKGLEFPVVIFPCDVNVTREIEPTVWCDYLEGEIFDSLNTSLISCSKEITYTGERGTKLFDQRQEELALDNFNLLYVALTRAVEQLYIITDVQLESSGVAKKNYFSGLFVDFLQNNEEYMRWDVADVTYSFGERERLELEKSVEEKSHAELQEEFISNSWENHEIKIVSNASMLWNESQQAKNYGLLIHEMLSKIICHIDVEKVVDSYVLSGDISKQESVPIIERLKNLVNHRELSNYFDGSFDVYTEHEILDKNGHVFIPDRIMIKDNKVVIIDYKTGRPQEMYKFQIENYAKILEEMQYVVLKKQIVYVDNQLIVSCV